ncbi:MAG TPA: adenylosuccinate lyase [Acidobacteriota bacterium]|jgi:adenylosuccinate lyase|nr:adenylosuccinate lyase [Acidobacteriota bacterium]
MIARYTLPEMEAVWSEEHKFRAWLKVEIAVCEVLAERGEIPPAAVQVIKDRADFTVERIREIEAVTRHDVIAFTTAVAEKVGPESRYIHLGLTSTDVVDTAQALLVREASDLIEGELLNLLETLRSQALRYKNTVMIGRTHGVHAEPTTFGLKLAVWYTEMQRHLERFRHARRNLEVGKISGPVGSFTHLPPEVEEAVCRKLGIAFAPVSTQTLQRDRHAEYLAGLALIAATYDKIATEIRHLQRTEVGEAAEPFAKGQKGSSAMPHKRNPVTCEQICGLSRVVRSNASVALDNVPLWHERDISHSSAERVILPDSTTLIHYLTVKLNGILANLVVDAERMKSNLELTGGLIYSGRLLLELVRRGVLRETAYQWVQRNAMRVWDEKADFLELVLADEDIRRHLSEEEIRQTFDWRHALRNVDRVFQRVFEI